MEETRSNPALDEVVDIQGVARWQMYNRLQELGIACQCVAYQPLKVQVCSPATAIQLWSTTRQITASRQELAQWLELCWQSSCRLPDGK